MRADRLAAVALAALVGAGCPGSTPESASETAAASLPADLLEASWPLQVARDEVRAPFEASSGWASLVARSDVIDGVERLGRVGGDAAARAHADAASMYRQASRLAAEAILQTYVTTPKPTDPVEIAHLLTVSHALLGHPDAARDAESRLGDLDPSVAVWHAPWKAWLEAGADWPPDLSSLPLGLPEVEPGHWPRLESPPHYQLAEQVEGSSEIAVADPGALVALALYHDAAARAAASSPAFVDLYTVAYRLPAEGPVSVPEGEAARLPLEYLFGGDLLTPEDAAFLTAVLGGQGSAVASSWADRSLLAVLTSASMTGTSLDKERALELAATLREALLEGMKAKNGGTLEGFHRTFADQASVGLLRSLALIAEADGQHEGSGFLRLNAWERSTSEHTATPAFLLSMAAWDAGNRYPLRATEILHNLVRRVPSLESARFGVDALALRVSREHGPMTPGQ